MKFLSRTILTIAAVSLMGCASKKQNLTPAEVDATDISYNEAEDVNSETLPGAMMGVDARNAAAVMFKTKANINAEKIALQDVLNAAVNSMDEKDLMTAIERSFKTVKNKEAKLNIGQKRRILSGMLSGVVASMKPQEVSSALNVGLNNVTPEVLNDVLLPAAGGYNTRVDYNPFKEQNLEF